MALSAAQRRGFMSAGGMFTLILQAPDGTMSIDDRFPMVGLLPAVASDIIEPLPPPINTFGKVATQVFQRSGIADKIADAAEIATKIRPMRRARRC